MPEITASEWENLLAQYPDAHLLQTRAWGDLKSAFGWDAAYVLASRTERNDHVGEPSNQVGAQVLFRSLPLGMSLAYIPKGPVGGYRSGSSFESLPQPISSVTEDRRQSEIDANEFGWEALWPEVDQVCRQRRAIFLKVEPDIWQTGQSEGAGRQVVLPDFRHSQQDIQPPRTLVVDLAGSEEQVLARMKQKTRYNVRLALKKGVVVYPSADLEAFYRLMVATGKRDAFGVHSLAYYRRAYEIFHPRGECVILMAEYQRQPLAAIMVFARGRRAWYFYGASSDQSRERMPTYLLQWEGMRWARARGCTSYDLWGVPDADLRTLEAGFEKRGDGLWGIYRFKRGFGGELRRALGPWDRVYHRFLYASYRLFVGLRSGGGS